MTVLTTTNSYDTALRRLELLSAEDGPEIGGGSGTRALLHGRRTRGALLLLHGLASAPPQFALLGERLHARGWNVLIPRLPHHGHADPMTTSLADLTADDLRAAAAEALAITAGLGERVTVAGFSMGGTLSAWLAHHRHEVEHAVAISPFLGVSLLPAGTGGLLAHALRRLPNRFLWWDPLLRERQRLTPHGYPRFATRAAAAVLTLAEATLRGARAGAPAARRITVVAHRREPACNTRDALALVEAWRRNPNADVRVEMLTGLPSLHDIIEPGRPQTPVSLVYPRLIEIIDAPHGKEAR
ncbi:MAG TPA: alpha/beta fold hydrolase [Candidatus Dormibacteraeota bacterium]|nr:alpha/beta fold hydrolase [Candidatus Dormibacteraeota bacterium]